MGPLEPQTSARGSQAFMILAAVVVVAGGMRLAADIIVPFLAAIFVTVVSLPPTAMLVKIGIRRWIAALMVFFVVFTVAFGTTTAVATAATSFASELPYYEELLRQKLDEWVLWLQSKGASVTTDQIDDILDPSVLFPYLQSVLTSLLGLVKSTFFVLLTVVFILMEASVLPGKLQAIAKTPEDNLAKWQKVLKDLQGYLAVKTYTSLATGTIIGIGCLILGVPYPIIFGLIAFVLNYVPALGSIIAAIPAVVIALLLNGPFNALMVAGLFAIVNISIGNLLEPRIMGRRMGLSPLVVFLSLVFWGFILGPVGMFLSVPLTMIVKILLEGTEDLRWLGIILGPGGSAAFDAAKSSSKNSE